MRMHKVEHCTLHLPQLSIVGYSEEAITTLIIRITLLREVMFKVKVW